MTGCKFCLRRMVLSVWESGSRGGRAEAGKPQEAAEGCPFLTRGAGLPLVSRSIGLWPRRPPSRHRLGCAEVPSRGPCGRLSEKCCSAGRVVAVRRQKGMDPGPTDGQTQGRERSPGSSPWEGPVRTSGWMGPRSPRRVLPIHLPGEGGSPLNPPPSRSRQGVRGQEAVEEEQRLRRTLRPGCLGQRSLEPPGGQPRGRRLAPGAELSGLRWACPGRPLSPWAARLMPRAGG